MEVLPERYFEVPGDKSLRVDFPSVQVDGTVFFADESFRAYVDSVELLKVNGRKIRKITLIEI